MAEPGVIFVPLLASKLKFVALLIITILSTVPLRSVTSVLSSLSARTFPLRCPVLAFFVSAAEHVRAIVSTISSLVSLKNPGIGFPRRGWTLERILLRCGEGKVGAFA